MSEDERKRISAWLRQHPATSFAGLTEVLGVLAAEVVEGNLPPDIVTSLLKIYEMQFTTIAADLKSKEGASGADAAVQRLVQVAQQAKMIAPVYSNGPAIDVVAEPAPVPLRRAKS